MFFFLIKYVFFVLQECDESTAIKTNLVVDRVVLYLCIDSTMSVFSFFVVLLNFREYLIRFCFLKWCYRLFRALFSTYAKISFWFIIGPRFSRFF